MNDLKEKTSIKQYEAEIKSKLPKIIYYLKNNNDIYITTSKNGLKIKILNVNILK